MTRQELAERFAAGLAGWFQQLVAQGLDEQVGEDAARVELVRMVSAQRRHVPETSKRPTNWPTSTKKRIDIAVLGKSTGATGWYGAMELKWPRENMDVCATRQAIVEDAVRVAFARTSNLCANFVVLGGTSAAIQKLFDDQHPQSQVKEAQRLAFCKLFHRDPADPNGFLANPNLNQHFPDFGDRVPQTTFAGWSRRLRTELVTRSESRLGSRVKGEIYVWQCKK